MLNKNLPFVERLLWLSMVIVLALAFLDRTSISFDACQQALASCLAGNHENPSQQFTCQDAYDKCARQCIFD